MLVAGSPVVLVVGAVCLGRCGLEALSPPALRLGRPVAGDDGGGFVQAPPVQPQTLPEGAGR